MDPFLAAIIVSSVGSLISAFVAPDPHPPRSAEDKLLEARVRDFREISAKRKAAMQAASIISGLPASKFSFGQSDYMEKYEVVREASETGAGVEPRKVRESPYLDILTPSSRESEVPRKGSRPETREAIPGTRVREVAPVKEAIPEVREAIPMVREVAPVREAIPAEREEETNPYASRLPGKRRR